MHDTCVSAWVPQPITPSEVAPSRARYFAATALAAPVRRRPSLSASISATSSGLSTAKSATTNSRPVIGCGVRLDTRVAELEVGRGHVGQPSLLQFEATPRRNLHRAGTHPSKRPFDGFDGICRSEQLLHVVLRQEERHTSSVPSCTMILSPSILTTASQGTALGACALGRADAEMLQSALCGRR